jgi:hypothetical protein
MIRAAALSLALAAPAHAAPVWVDGIGFRWLDAAGQIAADDCWDGKAGQPIDCALLAPMPARVVPRPRPPCLTPRTPGCPAQTFRWAEVKESFTRQPFGNAGWLLPLVVSDCGCGYHQPPLPLTDDRQPPAIPLPASGLLLAGALALLWRWRR